MAPATSTGGGGLFSSIRNVFSGRRRGLAQQQQQQQQQVRVVGKQAGCVAFRSWNNLWQLRALLRFEAFLEVGQTYTDKPQDETK